MFDHTSIVALVGLVVLAAPLALLCVLGFTSLASRNLGEELTSRLCQATNVIGLLAALLVLSIMLIDGTRYESIELAQWVAIPPSPSEPDDLQAAQTDVPHRGYHFSVKLVFDRLSVPFAILSFVLCGAIAAFASRYMHREQGYNRFFVLYALFVLGVILTSLAGTIETLFAGWELVGLSSVLLVAYFQERQAPARNGLWVWVVYRISDAALLLAAVVMHHLRGEGDFNRLLGGGPWPEGEATVSEGHALAVGLLLVVAAAGKSALVPFSGWLPRAMEGPTPTSAIFYGALSVHLGAFLLLRVSPLLDESAILSGVVVALGLTTALYAYLVGSVQTDIKSALSFASLLQVGLIVAEIGLGLRYVALVHLLGNACLRTLQLIRAPSLLQDYHSLENALGERLPHLGGPQRWTPGRVRGWLYRFALERAYLDTILADWIVGPFLGLFRTFDALERRWAALLKGETAHDTDPAPSSATPFEDLP